LDLLETHESLLVLAILAGSFVLFSLGEVLLPRRRPERDMGWRWLNNVGITLTSLFVVRQVKFVVPIAAALWVSAAGVGLLQVVEAGWVTTIVLTFLMLDFASYAYHRLSHRVLLLWRLHVVHHSDTEFDLTTAYRNHPINVILALATHLPAIIILGAPVYALALYAMVTTAVELFAHSNIRLPERLDRFLRYVVVTPDYHRIHHSSTRQFTDSNFAATFPLIDHLFGTVRYRPYAEHEDLEVGLAYFRTPRDSRLDQLLLMPFRKYSQDTRPETDDLLSLFPKQRANP